MTKQQIEQAAERQEEKIVNTCSAYATGDCDGIAKESFIAGALFVSEFDKRRCMFQSEIDKTKDDYDNIVNGFDEYWGCDESKLKLIEHIQLYIRHNFNKHDAEFIKIEVSDKYQR